MIRSHTTHEDGGLEGYLYGFVQFHRNHPTNPVPQSFVRFTSPTASFVIMFLSTLCAPLVALSAYTAGVLAISAVSDTSHPRKWVAFWLARHPLME